MINDIKFIIYIKLYTYLCHACGSIYVFLQQYLHVPQIKKKIRSNLP